MKHTPTILLVDDDEQMRDVLSMAVHSIGCRTIHATDGQEAIECLEQVRPDLIILDINMPRMNGLQFLAETKRGQATSGIPIIVFTSMQQLFHPDLRIDGVSKFLVKGETRLTDVIEQVRLTLGCFDKLVEPVFDGLGA